ncbi:hypothetical protein A3H89_03045 [Candidatus Amesbacteria bacterium RIFCSPLOWO2_02_FULL_48_11]|uniref:Pyridoxamine 5'-phosphate oxidase N-terminal domain-containing protein n=2 Tax=Candidatus Amesiibacteriota TaxID=1752730 RepID=A0A1F4Z917_9BACT|nr:MAG: hypothetical protein UX78_C0005G0041 [Candidatus Amesbacteria bacterium GW2011_GWA2_47_11]OGD02396.1 MAG: hypothetical protein A3E17_04875 [Candidatus Amesbacteria bacterium RIFCSPHIGHO2_12_FULL_48_14]OGD02478.1 MAG: hypothetical protein A2354_01900 [Candidatus Amesbacteria bacterium RIFOXYB1_FULL_47_12]OGD08659.1 MAG: hypothetical protein A3H89_03045 [Candidatus Amesbacteria bacterium RIFCSPLOWO2_02_FULL_48_11]
MSLSKDQIKTNITEFLKNHGILTLATVSGFQPWVATVYYAVDDRMNLIILTDPASRHGREMAKNSRVAFSIFDSGQPNAAAVKIGLQGTGIISPIKGVVANTKALLAWHRTNPGKEKDITIKDVIKTITDCRMYQITPKYLKHFNKALYSKEKYGTISL